VDPYLPDGEDARDVARRLRTAAGSLQEAVPAVRAQLDARLISWQGVGRDSWERVLAPCLRMTADAADSLHSLAGDLDALAGDLDHVARDRRALIVLESLSDVLLVGAVAQAGLDPVSDIATGWARGGLAGARAVVADGLAAAVGRVTLALASRAAVTTSVRGIVRWAAPRVGVAVAADALLEQALFGEVSNAELLQAGVLGVVPLADLGERTARLRRLARIFPAGLRAADHEGRGGGHALARHAGKDDAYLQRRIVKEGKPFVSSFDTAEGLDRALLETLVANTDEVEAFAAGTRIRARFTAPLPPGVSGRAFRRGRFDEVIAVDPNSLDAVTVALVRDRGTIRVSTVFLGRSRT